MNDIYRIRLRIGAAGIEYENAGIVSADPYAAVTEAIGELLSSVEVIEVARFINIDEGWAPVYPAPEPQ